MQIVWAIYHMFPDANKDNTEVTIFPDGSWDITKWTLPVLKPLNADIEKYWNDHQQEILDANKQPKTDTEILQDTILAIMDLLP
jgi:hypothetical protein